MEGKHRIVGEFVVTHNRIGAGSFAVVYQGFHRETKEQCAVKVVNREKLNEKLLKNLDNEIDILRSLNHPNIVRLFHVERTMNHIFLVFEYCSGGDLAKYRQHYGKLSESVCRSFLRHLVNALLLLRSRNIVHRDLKPHNILLQTWGNDAVLKLADFGFARYMLPQTLAETLCGSPLYMAPEVLEMQNYDSRADLWSVGTILYELLCGKTPYSGASQLDLRRNIRSMDVSFPSELNLSVEVKDLISNLLRRNPEERMSFEAFFGHAFIGPLNDYSVQTGSHSESTLSLPDLDTICNFSECGTDEVHAIAVAESKGKIAYVIYEGAEEKRNIDSCDSCALYLASMNALKDVTVVGPPHQKSPTLHGVLEWCEKLWGQLLARVRNLRVDYCPVVDGNEILLRHALELGKRGTLAEEGGNLEKSRKLYIRCQTILDYLVDMGILRYDHSGILDCMQWIEVQISGPTQ